MKNNKFLYLLITVIFIYFTGCEGSDPARKPAEKKMPLIRLQYQKKRNLGKGDHLRQGKNPLKKAITKKRPMSG